VTDAILTLNVGSSSLKFALFGRCGASLELAAKGQIEGIGTAPHMVARDARFHPGAMKKNARASST
jgi:acetate kinase